MIPTLSMDMNAHQAPISTNTSKPPSSTGIFSKSSTLASTSSKPIVLPLSLFSWKPEKNDLTLSLFMDIIAHEVSVTTFCTYEAYFEKLEQVECILTEIKRICQVCRRSENVVILMNNDKFISKLKSKLRKLNYGSVIFPASILYEHTDVSESVKEFNDGTCKVAICNILAFKKTTLVPANNYIWFDLPTRVFDTGKLLKIIDERAENEKMPAMVHILITKGDTEKNKLAVAMEMKERKFAPPDYLMPSSIGRLFPGNDMASIKTSPSDSHAKSTSSTGLSFPLTTSAQTYDGTISKWVPSKVGTTSKQPPSDGLPSQSSRPYVSAKLGPSASTKPSPSVVTSPKSYFPIEASDDSVSNYSDHFKSAYYNN